MKIIETIERECCELRDLEPYRGCIRDISDIRFCKHCGELWRLEVFSPADGERDTRFVRLFDSRSPFSAFLDLASHGGAWVRAEDCSRAEISNARQNRRWLRVGLLDFVRRDVLR